jgi:glycosyltransferase involved in cell wall biosynthesis
MTVPYSVDWAAKFKARHGRRPRVLHVSNIANNAYLNARILTDVGIENHVIANDLYHFGSCPEWFDSGGVKLDRDLIGEDFFPDFWRAGLSDSSRPRWFAQAPQFLAVEYLVRYCDGDPLHELAWAAMQYERFKTTICKNTMPERLWLDEKAFNCAAKSSRLDPVTRAMFEKVRSYQPIMERMFACFGELYGPKVRDLISQPLPVGYADAFEALVADKEIFKIWRDLRQKGLLAALGFELADLTGWTRPIAPKGVDQKDADVFSVAQGYWERLYKRYDYVINYGTAPYFGLINRRKYLAYEHGTIRSIPFDDNVIGRLTHASYQYAGAVFITNIDYITAQKRVALDAAKIHYIPHAFDETPLIQYLNDHTHLMPPKDCATFFWPTRQDWTSRDIRMAKQNDIAIRALALVAKRTEKPFRIVAVDWGVDAQESKDLAAELDVAVHFEWIGPVSKQELWARYMTSHAVVDHFIGESVNGTQCEAMMLARPVICSDCNVCGITAYGAPPPYLAGTSVEEVAEQFLKVINDPADAAGHGKAGFDWMMEHHSKAVITSILVKALDTTPNGVNEPGVQETIAHLARTLPGIIQTKVSVAVTSANANLKAQASLAAWHVKNTGAQVKFRADNAAWHVKNQSYLAAWHARGMTERAKNQASVALVEAGRRQVDTQIDWELDVPSYYFDVEQPPLPEGEKEEVEQISWGELFRAVFSWGFVVYVAKANYRKLMRKIGVYPKSTVLWFGKEAQELGEIRESVAPNEEIRQALINGKSVALNLFDDLQRPNFDVRSRLGALVPGNAYVAYWHEPSNTWYGIGPNADMLDEEGRPVIAAARSIGPSGPVNATINIWGVVFRFGPDGAVRHNGDTVGWIKNSSVDFNRAV